MMGSEGSDEEIATIGRGALDEQFRSPGKNLFWNSSSSELRGVTVSMMGSIAFSTDSVLFVCSSTI